MSRFSGEPYQIPELKYIFPYVNETNKVRGLEYTNDGGFIYKITSPSGKIYVGKTVNLVNRLSCYKGNHTKNQIKISNSIKKYGWINHDFEIIDYTPDKEKICDLEIYWINKLDTFNTFHGMNLTKGGEGTVGKKMSEAQKKFLSESRKGKPSKLKGTKRPELSRKGFKHTDEAKEKIRIARAGKKLSNEHKLKLKGRNKGIKRPYEVMRPMLDSMMIPIYCITNGFAYKGQSHASRELKIPQSLVGDVISGKQTHTHGYKFKLIKIEDFLN